METKVTVGIDISKDSFDVALPFDGKAGYQHLKFTNQTAGFKKLCSQLPTASHCVMEASGVYFTLSCLPAPARHASMRGEPLNH